VSVMARVEKQGYSRGAWRVLFAESGEQVWHREVFDHPQMGRVAIPAPVCFERKRDAVAWVAERTAAKGETDDQSR
jgi:hypothetical protein